MDQKQKNIRGVQVSGPLSHSVDDSLALEAPLQIIINDEPYSVTMRTPGDDEDLTRGFLYTEGIINRSQDIQEYHEREETEIEGASSSSVLIPVEKISEFNLSNRNSISSSSCGVCGKTKLCELHMPQDPLVCDFQLPQQSFKRLREKMEAAQVQFKHTGGCHGAALFDAKGELLAFKEDVGRHNAVDKSVGYALKNNTLWEAKVLYVTGRVSYEIVMKAYVAGIPFILAISAPSSMAVSVCKNAGITLVGFCRGNRGTVYTHQENIQGI